MVSMDIYLSIFLHIICTGTKMTVDFIIKIRPWGCCLSSETSLCITSRLTQFGLYHQLLFCRTLACISTGALWFCIRDRIFSETLCIRMSQIFPQYLVLSINCVLIIPKLMIPRNYYFITTDFKGNNISFVFQNTVKILISS